MRLFIGDVVVILLATLTGFMSHNIFEAGNAVRILATFVPFTLAWFFHGAVGGAFDPGKLVGRARVLRPMMIAALAAPSGGLFRGLWLGTVVQTTFILVMAGVTALGIGLWRSLDLYLESRRV